MYELLNFSFGGSIIIVILSLVALGMLALASTSHNRRRFEDVLALAKQYGVPLTPMNMILLRLAYSRYGLDGVAQLLSMSVAYS